MNFPVVRCEPHLAALVIAKDLVLSISDGETASFALQMSCEQARSVALLLNTLAFEREGLENCECAGSA